MLYFSIPLRDPSIFRVIPKYEQKPDGMAGAETGVMGQETLTGIPHHSRGKT